MKTKHKISALVIVLLVILAIGLSLILAYGLTLKDPVSIFFKKLYPSTFVGARYISIYDSEQGQVLGQSHDQLVKIKKEQNLIAKLGIKYNNSNFEDEFKFDTAGKSDEYQALLKQSFFDNENLFYEFVIKPQTYEALLRIKYNSDFMGNSKEYSRAQNVLSELGKGKTFEELAKTNSDDLVTAQLGGDLGFMTPDQILPELKTSLIGGANPHLAITRLGYDIILPVEKVNKDGQDYWHVKHILIQTSGFDHWLAGQL